MNETERQTPEKSRKNNEPQPHNGMKETANAPDQAREADQIIHESINFPDTQDDSKYNRLLKMTVEEFSKLPIEEQKNLTKNYIEATKELRASLGRLAKQIADLYGTGIFQELDKKEKALQPYLRKELEKPEYNGATPEDVFAYYNPFTGEPISMISEQPPEWWMEKHKITGQQALKAMEAAKTAKAASEKVNAVKPEKTFWPLDKLNSKVWNYLDLEETNGKALFRMSTDNDKATVAYSINFDELPEGVKLSRQIEPFDNLVYIACGALLAAGNSVTSASQIHAFLGGNGKPASKQVKRYMESITKMMFTKTTIDNEDEANKLKGIKRFKYSGYLLPAEIITAEINGGATETAIHFLKPSLPLMQFAQERSQVTAFSPKLLQNPYLRLTNDNIIIQNYLLTRISREKHQAKRRKISGKAASCKIVYATVYKETKMTTKKQQARAAAKIHDVLIWFKSCDFISKFSVDGKNDSVTVFWKQ